MPLKNNQKFFWYKTIVLISLFFYFIVLNIFQPSGNIKYTWHFGIWLPITSYVVLWEGRKYFKIYKRLLRFNLGMDTLVGLASHILFIYSIINVGLNWNRPMFSYEVMWEGSAVLILFTNIGYRIQERITSSSLDIYDKLNSMKSQFAIVIRNNEAISVNVSDIKIGEIILIKRGECVPLDGYAINGGQFDYSNITGEAKEVNHKANDFVLSGSFNIGDNVKIKIAKLAKDSTINHIIEKIEDVSSIRPPMQQLADKVLRIFIPSVILIAFTTFVIWLILGLTGNINVSWIKNNNALDNAIKAGVTTIAIACPCALGIATPLVYTVSAMIAAKRGILINNPKALEEVNKIKIIAFDKTGTITNERMTIVKIHGKTDYLSIASGLEKDIKHPIAEAISNYSIAQKIDNVKQITNIGVSGFFKGKKYEIRRYQGNEFIVDQLNTNIALYANNTPVLVYELANQIKDGVVETIEALQRLKIRTVMITGDKKEVAESIGKQINIDQIFSEVSPIEKAEIIKELQTEGKTAFVGDGFNDSIAIKQANISLAFSHGSDITNSLSDVSILSNDFSEIFSFFTLGKMNYSRVKLSLCYAFSFNVVVIPIAFLLLVQPWMGAAIMAASDILVALNALLYKLSGEKKISFHTKRKMNEHKSITRNPIFRK